jgi:small subunit ribosomal protein S6
MTLPAPTYDLVLLLDTAADDATREKLVGDARAAIEAQGELLRYDKWGERVLTYPIDKKTSAEYHLLQFHVSATELLDGLDRTLRLADEVLRFRIIKLAPGVPAAPDMSSGSAPAPRSEDVPAPAVEPAAPVAAEPAPPAPAPAEAEAPADTETPAAAEAPAEPAAEVAVGEPS